MSRRGFPRRWAANANVPVRCPLDTCMGEQKCRICGAILRTGDEVWTAPFAVGGLTACGKHESFYAPGERRQ